MSDIKKICQIGEVDFYSDEIDSFRKIHTRSEPRSGMCVLEMMDAIVSMARDIGDVSKPSRDALVEAIKYNVNGIVMALVRNTLLGGDKQ